MRPARSTVRCPKFVEEKNARFLHYLLRVFPPGSCTNCSAGQLCNFVRRSASRVVSFFYFLKPGAGIGHGRTSHSVGRKGGCVVQ